MGRDLAEKNGIMFAEASARTGEGVDAIFLQLVNDIKMKLIDTLPSETPLPEKKDSSLPSIPDVSEHTPSMIVNGEDVAKRSAGDEKHHHTCRRCGHSDATTDWGKRTQIKKNTWEFVRK